MYSNLPRHTFGYIQSKLFPKYFQTGAVLMTVVMCTFLWEHNQFDWKVKLQVCVSSRDLPCYCGNVGRPIVDKPGNDYH